jgi:hypothetical protein
MGYRDLERGGFEGRPLRRCKQGANCSVRYGPSSPAAFDEAGALRPAGQEREREIETERHSRETGGQPSVSRDFSTGAVAGETPTPVHAGPAPMRCVSSGSRRRLDLPSTGSPVRTSTAVLPAPGSPATACSGQLG